MRYLHNASRIDGASYLMSAVENNRVIEYDPVVESVFCEEQVDRESAWLTNLNRSLGVASAATIRARTHCSCMHAARNCVRTTIVSLNSWRGRYFPAAWLSALRSYWRAMTRTP